MKTNRNSLKTKNLARVSFCIMLSAALVLPSAKAAGEWNPAAESPYSFGPEGRPFNEIQEFAKPNQMMEILPDRPIAATDKYGNRMFFTPGGHMTVSISKKDGSMQFNLKTGSKEKDANGNLTQQTEKVRGTNRVEIKNDKGEVTGYQTLGLGGKVVQEFDHQGNLTKSYSYTTYGKSVESVTDELSQSKTVFDRQGKALYDVDFEGNKVAYYSYDAEGRLEVKQDMYGNRTSFDKTGNMLSTVDRDGNLMARFSYETDAEGNVGLARVEDVQKGETTYYKDGKQQYVKDHEGAVIQQYVWDGAKLVYSFKPGLGETTYYNINGKEIYTARNENIIKEWLYYKGRLVALFDEDTHTTQIFQYQREDVTRYTEDRPDAETIQKWYEEGLISEPFSAPR